jgi:hypothetical protein
MLSLATTRGPPSDRQLYPPSRQEADRGIAAPALHHAGQPGKLQRYYSGRPRGVIFWLRLKNQPGPVRTRLAFQPLCEVTRSRPRPARTRPLAGVCLVGLRVPHVAPGGRGPRRVAPVRRAGRSTVHRWAGCAMTGAGLLGRGSERDRHHRPGAVSSLHGMARATRPHLQPRPVSSLKTSRTDLSRHGGQSCPVWRVGVAVCWPSRSADAEGAPCPHRCRC